MFVLLLSSFLERLHILKPPRSLPSHRLWQLLKANMIKTLILAPYIMASAFCNMCKTFVLIACVGIADIPLSSPYRMEKLAQKKKRATAAVERQRSEKRKTVKAGRDL